MFATISPSWEFPISSVSNPSSTNVKDPCTIPLRNVFTTLARPRYSQRRALYLQTKTHKGAQRGSIEPRPAALVDTRAMAELGLHRFVEREVVPYGGMRWEWAARKKFGGMISDPLERLSRWWSVPSYRKVSMGSSPRQKFPNTSRSRHKATLMMRQYRRQSDLR